MELTWEKTLERRRIEGKVEGGIEALRQVVLRLLGRRFGAAPSACQVKKVGESVREVALVFRLF